MHAKLTQAVAEKCEPNSGDYEIVDTLIPGFVLRVRPSGVKAWEYRYRNQEGRQRRYVVGRFPGIAPEKKALGSVRRRLANPAPAARVPS